MRFDALASFLKNTDRDWNRRGRLRCLLALARKDPATAADIMTAPVISRGEEAHVAELSGIFSTHGINHVPVTDVDGRLAGNIARLDLLNRFGDPLHTRQAA